MLTPNSLEARRLAQDEADDDDYPGLPECARRLLALGCEYVLITGTHENTPEVVNTLYTQGGVVRSDTWPRLPGSFHGSGCTLAAAIAATIANGLDISEAVRDAQDYTWQTLNSALSARHGAARSRSAVLGAGGRQGRRRRVAALLTHGSFDSHMTDCRSRVRGLYAVTPETAQGSWLRTRVEQALAGGAQVVQYRSKSRDHALKRSQARELAGLCRQQGVLFIVNDDVEIARECHADGVHLGREDTSIAAARVRLGHGVLIGASCYDDLARAQECVDAGADYLAFGSFFASRGEAGRRATRARCAERGSQRAGRCRWSRSAASRLPTRRLLWRPAPTPWR